jgi:glycosyltransferase involved in cell wall biosynthesis
MKVGILIDQLAPGSAPKVVGQEVKGLKTLGYDCEAIVLKKGYAKTYNFHLYGVPITCLSDSFPSMVNILDVKFPGFSFFSTHHITSSIFAPFVVKEREWDVLVAHISFTCLTARMLSKLRKIPYLAFIGTEPHYYLTPRIYSQSLLGPLMPVLVPLAFNFDKYVVEDCLAIITYSKFYHNLIRPYTDKELEVVHPGCFPVDRPNEKRENFILTYDRWDIGNTPRIFLDMLPRLNREINLVVAGHWHPQSIQTSFLQKVVERGLSGRVRVLGPINEEGITELCSRALVHVHPNKEAFGMQSLEAAGCGCPTVIPAGSGVTEILKDGEHGLFPKDESIDSYVECVDKIVADPEKAKKMGREAWKVAKRNTWTEHSKRLAHLINKYV